LRLHLDRLEDQLTKRFIATAGVGLALLAAGCGGGGEGGGTADGGPVVKAGSLSKAEFIKRGDAICAKAGAQLLAETKSYLEKNGIDAAHPPSDELQVELVEQVLLPTFRAQIEDLAALGALPGDVEGVQAILDAISEAADEVEANPNIDAADPFGEANAMAKDFGFRSCGEI
jgi:hypothetical protein